LCKVSEGDTWSVGLEGYNTDLWPLVWNGFDAVEPLFVVEEDVEGSTNSLYLELGV
jgi:hypothetical protein